jgi:RNA polymerase sigma-70 factor (ECF subfamily)
LQDNTQEITFLQLVKEHQKMIHKICHLYGHTPHEREDLFQEIVVQSWKGYTRFRGDAKFSTWLYRVALNTAISSLRKKEKNIAYVDPFVLPVTSPEIVDINSEQEQLQQMYEAIRKLCEIDRAIVMLYLEDTSYEEMEEILGITQNHLRVKMNRIKEKLRKLTNQ